MGTNTTKKINTTTALKILDHCRNINGNKNINTNYDEIVKSHSNEANHFFTEYCSLIKSGNLTPEEKKDCFQQLKNITENSKKNTKADREEKSEESSKELVGLVITGIIGLCFAIAFAS